MPLQLLAYTAITGKPAKKELPIYRRLYEKFGGDIMVILSNNALESGVLECEFMADLRRMKRLLGNNYELVSVRKGRCTSVSRVKLNQMITAKRYTCVLDGVDRYIVVRKKKL